MQAELLVLTIASLACVPVVWMLPRNMGQDAVAAIGFIVLLSISPVSAIWLVGSAALTFGALRLGGRLRNRGMVTGLAGSVLVAGFLAGRELPVLELVGIAYVTLRNLHLLFDGWMGRDDQPATLRETLQYHLFLPVLGVGPIHRFPAFRRALRRRNFDPAELARGAERALFGLAMATVLGTGLMAGIKSELLPLPGGVGRFWQDLAASALDWVQLYFVFAGMSGFAVGTALMMGLVIEENFDRPYAAKSLLDFWTRWHMSLTSWCRDYVFQPVTAATRNPLAGLFASMVVIGLWHETSAYYLLWAVWQVLGIVLNRLMIGWMGRRGISVPTKLLRVVAPILILGWLSLARPVINLLLWGRMTPIYDRLSRRFPRPVAAGLLGLLYAVLLLLILIGIGVEPPDIVYVDVPDAGGAP